MTGSDNPAQHHEPEDRHRETGRTTAIAAPEPEVAPGEERCAGRQGENESEAEYQRDAFAWYLGILYLVNIVDAYVGAELYDFDVGPELGAGGAGARATFRLHL